jgi:ketosteroid isomerase-like protein
MFSDPKRPPNQSDHVLGANSLSAGETDRIRTLIEHWTSDLMAGRIAEWERFWAEEAVLMPAGHERITGRSNIRDFITHAFRSGSDYRFSEWSYAGGEDLAVVANRVEFRTEAADGRDVMAFNQVIVLRRREGQQWCIQTVIFTPTTKLD